jgi:glycosyltransferase involved in cell wall biosynthesis
MPFAFLTYLQPTHYFRLFTKVGFSVFPKVAALPETVSKQLQADLGYTSPFAQDYDLSWQAVQTGYIGSVETYTDFKKLPIEDEYRFIRKHFHPIWVLYVFFCRICSFYNPFIEFKAWLSSTNIKRQTKIEPIAYPEWKYYKSPLLDQTPLVSVVIPTLNRYNFLKDVLHDFEKQDYPHFEILVVDQSEPFQPEFYKTFQLQIRVIRQEEKALWLARNTAIKASKGEFIALSEDDVRIQTDWISTHLKALNFFEAQVSAGVFYPEGQDIPKDRSFFTIASQFATGNAMLYKSVFKQVGLFDRQYEKQRMGDGEFGLRVYLEGIKSVSNPFASCIDVKAGTGGLREMGSWDGFRPKKWFDPRPVPSVLYQFRTYYGKKPAILALLKTVPPSIIPYRFKRKKIMMIFGALVSIIIFPLVLIQVMRSWYLSSKKLQEGPKIERL